MLMLISYLYCRPRDIYHSCYTLSGLSVSQYSPDGSIDVVGRKKNLLVSYKQLKQQTFALRPMVEFLLHAVFE